MFFSCYSVDAQRETVSQTIELINVFGIFFFFVENPDPRVKFIEKEKDYKKSWYTRGAMSSGVDSIQTCSSLPDLTFLAR